MDLKGLPRTKSRSAKRVGRGYGSGKGGHTTGRGAKGQKIREKVPLTMEGTKIKKSLLKRLPLLRGKGRFKAWGKKRVVLSLERLKDWPTKIPISRENLIKESVIGKHEEVKILGKSELKQALIVRVSISKSAKESVEKAGGKVESET